MFVFKIIWFFLPAYAANIAASVFKIKFLTKPISEKLFGSNKTYFGFVVGIIAAVIISIFQKLLFTFYFFQKISYLNYSINFLLIGFLLGFGALLGDLAKSFFKRRVGIAPGQKWVPFDQIDYTLGAILLSLFFWQPTISFIIASIFLNLFFHILFNHLGFWLGIRKSAW